MDKVVQERDEYIESLLRKQDDLNGELYSLKRTNNYLRNELKEQAKQLRQIREEQRKQQKPFYKNGKRGTKFNG